MPTRLSAPRNQKNKAKPAPIETLRTRLSLLHRLLCQTHTVVVATHQIAYDEQYDDERHEEKQEYHTYQEYGNQYAYKARSAKKGKP